MTCANWANLGSEIKKTVSTHVKDHPIEVKFLPGDLCMLQSGGVSFTDSLNHNGRPAMGHSVGIVGEQNTGTLGGYVTLTQGGKVHKGFLTNYHVVRPSGTEERLDRFGCTLLHPPAKDIQIESLAGMDRDATMFNIEQRLKTMNRQIEDFSIKIEEQEKIGARPLPMLKERIEECECAISDLRDKHEVVLKVPRLMGKVATVSGQSILGRRIMDWAFVELPDEAAKEYFKPNKMFHAPPGNMPHLSDISFGVPITEGKLLNQVGQLEKDQFYLKLGRSTGVTAGICNGALACCNWQGRDRARLQHDGQQVALSPGLTEEFVIINKKVGQSNSQQMPFAESGDSGSLVINIDGQVCGLLYGAISGFYGPPGQGKYYSNAGLAMDFTELSNSIKLRTLERGSDGNIVTPPAELALPEDS